MQAENLAKCSRVTTSTAPCSVASPWLGSPSAQGHLHQDPEALPSESPLAARVPSHALANQLTSGCGRVVAVCLCRMVLTVGGG